MSKRESKNYRNGKEPPLLDVYDGYCFAFENPLGNGKKKPNRIIPGDDTPRTFIRCNLVNAIPPPGSTLISCNTSIIERNLETGAADSKGNPIFECIVHGHTDPIGFGEIDNPNKSRIRQ